MSLNRQVTLKRFINVKFSNKQDLKLGQVLYFRIYLNCIYDENNTISPFVVLEIIVFWSGYNTTT